MRVSRSRLLVLRALLALVAALMMFVTALEMAAWAVLFWAEVEPELMSLRVELMVPVWVWTWE